MRKGVEAISLIILFLLAGWVSPAIADGPWQAQVVDAETKQPLEGVVVLAVWDKHMRGFGVHGDLGYGESEEVLTDKDGRFTIAARSSFTLNPFVYLKDPEFLIFKSGYGRAVWPEYKNAEQWPKEKREQLNSYARLFQLDGIVIEMSRLRTLDERKEYLGKARIGFLTVPREKTPLLQDAITVERRAVGYRD